MAVVRMATIAGEHNVAAALKDVAARIGAVMQRSGRAEQVYLLPGPPAMQSPTVLADHQIAAPCIAQLRAQPISHAWH